MITDAFINLSYYLLNSIIGFLPIGSGFPNEVHTAVDVIGGYLALLDPIVPITTLATVVALSFSVEIAIFGFKTLKWLVSYIPFIGGRA